MASSDYYFFTDTNLLVAQAATDAYGPIAKTVSTDPDEYRVTSLHTATMNPTAYAACDAILCVQRIPSTSLVNVILKPLVQPALNFAPVKYIIYKGVLANSLIDTNGTDVAPLGNNDLTKFLWAEQAKKNKSVTPNTTATAPANALGIDLTGTNFANTDPIDNLFYRAGVAFQLPVVKGGWSIGQFDKTKFGMEVLMEGLNFNQLVSSAREIETKISVTSLTGSENDAQKFDHWHAKEQVLGFMDPCAFYGSFFLAGVMSKSSGTGPFATKSGNALYNDLLFRFANKNTAYLDIRNEHNFSFNYFKNYGESIQLSYDPKSANPALANYYRSNWPVLTLTATNFPANTTTARNPFRIQLPVGDNPQPLLYISQGYRDINSKGNGFPTELKSAERFYANFLQPVGGYTATKGSSGLDAMDFVVPNVIGQTGATPASCYLRLKYLRQQQGTSTVSTALQSVNYLDNLIYPLDLKILFTGTSPIKSAVYDEEVYVNAHAVPGLACDFVGKVGIARDGTNTYLFAMPTIVRTNDGQASTYPSFTSETSDDPGGYLSVLASKYPKYRVRRSDLLLSATQTVPVAELVSDAYPASASKFGAPDFSKLLLFTVANAAYDSWKTDLAAVGAALDNRFRIYLGVKNFQSGTDTAGVAFRSFELVLRGFALDTNTANYKVQEMSTAP